MKDVVLTNDCIFTDCAGHIMHDLQQHTIAHFQHIKKATFKMAIMSIQSMTSYKLNRYLTFRLISSFTRINHHTRSPTLMKTTSIFS